MKWNITLTITGAVFALVIPSNAEAIRVTAENIAFVYESKAEIPTPPEILASLISEDYLHARDEFSAREMFQKIEPVIIKRLAAAKATELWKIEITKELPSYDFTSNSFPTGLTETTFIPFSASSQNYAAIFTNHELFRKVPVEIEAAKKLSANLRKSRLSTLIVEGVVKESLEKNMNYSKRKTISFEISKVSIKMEDGTFIGEFPLTEQKINQESSAKIPDTDGKSKAVASNPGSPMIDPVGEWTTKGRSPGFSLCLWESGAARGEVGDKGLAINLEGNWLVIKDGRWKGYVMFSGKVDYWAINQQNLTPKDEKFEFLLGLDGDRLTYVKGGVLTDKNGGKFYPSGEQANNDPVLTRQNSQRPIHRESGNR